MCWRGWEWLLESPELSALLLTDFMPLNRRRKDTPLLGVAVYERLARILLNQRRPCKFTTN